MIPIRRNLHFRLTPESVLNWHEQGRFVTQFINAMSIFFPSGERYFIHTVRHYSESIKDPALKEAVSAFIGQEAMHGREHELYNKLLTQAGLPADELEKHASRFLDFLKAHLPAPAQLSVTIAQEHFTAIMSDLVLTDPRMIAGASRRLSALWRWHAMEETEHKSVAFDVYESVMGRGIEAYVLRAGSMVLTTAGFITLVLYYQQRLLAADGSSHKWTGFGRFANFMLRTPGLLPRLAVPWVRYFRPGFHPWEHQNQRLVEQMSALIAETQRYTFKAA